VLELSIRIRGGVCNEGLLLVLNVSLIYAYRAVLVYRTRSVLGAALGVSHSFFCECFGEQEWNLRISVGSKVHQCASQEKAIALLL
jgi:hypothetical protein